jgi:hypothetical protein
MPDGHKFEKQHLGGGSCPRPNYISSTRLQSKVVLALALSIWGGLIAEVRGELSSNASVFAVGLDYPRGLRFGPDGYYMSRKPDGAVPTRPLAFVRKMKARVPSTEG